jgi:anti-anti-sigma regulatory factor
VPELSVAEVRHFIDKACGRSSSMPGIRPPGGQDPGRDSSTAGRSRRTRRPGDRMWRTKTARTHAGTHGWPVSDKQLTVETRQAGACTILVISGRMTIHSSFHLRPVLHAAVAAASPAGVLIDFTRTAHLDTSAAATLIEAAMLARDRGVPLRVIGLGGQPRLLAEVIEVDRIFRALGSDVEFV